MLFVNIKNCITLIDAKGWISDICTWVTTVLSANPESLNIKTISIFVKVVAFARASFWFQFHIKGIHQHFDIWIISANRTLHFPEWRRPKIKFTHLGSEDEEYGDGSSQLSSQKSQKVFRVWTNVREENQTENKINSMYFPICNLKKKGIDELKTSCTYLPTYLPTRNLKAVSWFWAGALVLWLWEVTHVWKAVGSNPSAVYWMNIFSHWFVVKIVLFRWKDRKLMKKRPRLDHFFKKLYRLNYLAISYCLFFFGALIEKK